MQVVNEMITFTGLHRNLLQNKAKEDNSIKRELRYSKTRWRLIQNQLNDNYSSSIASNSGEEGQVPFDTQSLQKHFMRH